MIIIIDAYNLLHAVPPYKKTITDRERVAFIAQLSAYGRAKGHKMVIVFDGGPYEWPHKENGKTVQVVYSGIHESADDYIKEYVDTHKAKDLLLVTSDSELNCYAERLNIASIDSSTFFGLLREGLAAQKSSDGTHQNNTVKLTQDKEFNRNAQDVLDRLMLDASKTVIIKSEDFAADGKKEVGKSVRSKKHERVLLKKLNKL